MSLEDIWKKREGQSRSITPENRSGGKGQGANTEIEDGNRCARELGKGWKVSPNITIEAGQETILAEVNGQGFVRHMWMTPSGHWRHSILRIYWDDSDYPSVECPVGDFFCCGWNKFSQVSSLSVCVNPGSGLNCYWQMPFRRNFRITLENRDSVAMLLFYQIDYTLERIPDDSLYFHGQFRRANPLPYKQVYTILDNVSGQGAYVGTYIAWGSHSNGWWGEGEVKFYLDGDDEYPTICGTGTEDYICGSYNFEHPDEKRYQEFTTPYSGFSQVMKPDGLYQSQTRFGMYRWHLNDPILFNSDLRITMQALGWKSHGRYYPLQDDIATVAYWYQDSPSRTFPELPDSDYLEIV